MAAKEERSSGSLTIIVSPPTRFMGRIAVPGDKSISHRAAILAALARGTSTISNFLQAGDCLSTLHCLRALGVDWEMSESGRLLIRGSGMQLKPPVETLNAGNSGTTARLLLGVLAGQPFSANLTGDASLRRRPMKRVVEPLRLMGASVAGRGARLPLTIKGGRLQPIRYDMPVASAQVKSALLLAGLYAEGNTVVSEPSLSRNHTELMLERFGAVLNVAGSTVGVEGPVQLQAADIRVPGDISAAAFFLVAAALIPGAEVLIEEVGVNPTRAGIITLLQEMGAHIELKNRRLYGNEPVADLLVQGGFPLKGIVVGGRDIPRVIDELPVLAVAAALAEGITEIREAAELRVKEADRITLLVRELRKIGVNVSERPDGMVIYGRSSLRGATVDSHGDHRLAMTLVVAGLAAAGETVVRGAEAINISFPGFMSCLRQLI